MALQDINWSLGLLGAQSLGQGLSGALNATGLTPRGQYQNKLAELIGSGDYNGAAAAALGRGDSQTGNWLTRLQQEALQQKQQQAQFDQRMAMDERRLDADTDYRNRNLAADQSYRNQSLALQRMGYEQGKVPAGFRVKPDGTYEPIPGGPADPAYLQARTGAGGSEYGTTPIWGTDAQGNPSFIQLGKDGKPIQPQLPQGFSPARDPLRIDAGTSTVLVDPQTRQPIATVPKDIAGEAKAKEVGKGQGEAAAGLATARQTANQVTQQIADLKNDPYLKNMVGPINSRLPNISGDAARVQARIDQLQGGAFLQARQVLKGGGQITDYEGRKAEQAWVRMNQAQNIGDFIKALDEFNSAVSDGVAKLEGQAGGGQQRASQPQSFSDGATATNPQTGQKIIFRGGQWVPAQ